jgi:uncharacterized protein YndB with AHSA1/START domain
MTTPDVPHRFELTLEVPASADQVWHAIATGDGVSSWFLPHEIEGRVGGRFVAHMGEDLSSTGHVTGWEPPRRFAFEEDWATLVGHPEADVTPLATEFLVEARSGGSCVVRVVSSAFGTGADWEGEFFEEMGRYWEPFFDLLRLYAGRFAGQRAATRTVDAEIVAPQGAVARAMQAALGVTAPGQPLAALGLVGTTVRVHDAYILVEVTAPVAGYASLAALPAGPDKADRTAAQVKAWLFGPDAETALDEAAPAWQAWLAGLPVTEAVDR